MYDQETVPVCSCEWKVRDPNCVVHTRDRTHWEGCYTSHLDCAAQMAARLEYLAGLSPYLDGHRPALLAGAAALRAPSREDREQALVFAFNAALSDSREADRLEKEARRLLQLDPTPTEDK